MIMPKKNVQSMDEYKPPLEGRRGMLRLDFNENTIGPSPRVLEALRSMTDEELSAYPEYEPFRKKLAEYLGVAESRLLITNATDEAISVIMQAYINPSDELLLPVPTFAMFKFYAQVADAKIIEIVYKKNLQFPTDAVLKKISKRTRFIVLCNPNNPTSTTIKKDDVIKILEKAKDSIVMLDEAYHQFTEQSCKDLIGQYKNLVVIQTFSKAFGLGGLRLGYIMSDESNIRNIRKVLSPYSVNSAVIKAASAAIADDSYVSWYKKEVVQAKKYVFSEFRKLGIKTYDSEANFFLAFFGSKATETVEKLKTKGILVRDRSDYPLLKGCIRITIGTKQQMKRLVDALK